MKARTIGIALPVEIVEAIQRITLGKQSAALHLIFRHGKLEEFQVLPVSSNGHGDC